MKGNRLCLHNEEAAAAAAAATHYFGTASLQEYVNPKRGIIEALAILNIYYYLGNHPFIILPLYLQDKQLH